MSTVSENYDRIIFSKVKFFNTERTQIKRWAGTWKRFANALIWRTLRSRLECDITVAEHVFKYLEKYPDDDFGSPGSLVHYVEAAYPNYVDALLESIHRRPVSLTIWMINRILNSNIEVSLKLRLIGALKTISQNPLISLEEREQAIGFLSLH